MVDFAQAELIACLTKQLGSEYKKAKIRASGVSGLNSTFEVYGPGLASVFVKVGTAQAEVYRAEIVGLNLLRQCEALRIPLVIDCFQLEHVDVLAMEFIALGNINKRSAPRFGEALAALHGIVAPQFGLEADNFIGHTPQQNRQNSDWWPFFCDQRLSVQLAKCRQNGMRHTLCEDIEYLIEHIPDSLGEHQPAASLVHGDLWSGNSAVDETGQPVLFDPAVYFGDAETDLAMSRMFGSLDPKVYEVYHSIRPASVGIDKRRPVYDLYHWLNHFNLFGLTYLGQVEHTYERIAEDLML